MEIDKIYHGDCLELMKQIPDGSVDCIICDLPYEVLNKGNDNAKWDKIIPLDKLWKQYLRVSGKNAAIILFCQGMFTAKLLMSNPKLWKYNLVWEKNRGSGFLNAKRMPMRYHEDIAVFYRSQPTYNPQMWEGKPNHSRGNNNASVSKNCYGKVNGKPKDDLSGMKYPKSILFFEKEKDNGVFHPTQKPVALLEYLIKTYTNEGDLILDNCIGSGTTAIACIREHRHFIGMELNKEYFDKASERIRIELSQPSLF